MKDIRGLISENFQFLEVNFSRYLNRRVFVMDIFYYFPQKIGFDISCKLSPLHEMLNPIFSKK